VLLIDGYNVLFKTRGLDLRHLEEARARLVSRIAGLCAATGRTARVFFDPSRGGSGFRTVKRSSGVEVVQLSESSADEAIRTLVTASGDRTQYRVVSSDREVAGAAEKAGFATTTAEDFLAELEAGERGRPPEKPDGCDPPQVKYWMDQFGLGGTQP
jgi:predicted RNA-binding protein with PIN domain